MRAFLAIEPRSAEILNQVKDFQKLLLETGADLRLVEEKNIHMTVKFLGEIEEIDAEEVIKRLRNLDIATLNTSYQGIGVFPSRNRVSVVWVGVHSDKENKLIEISEKINGVLSGLPFGDDKRFLPHLTIARVRSGRSKASLLETVGYHEDRWFGRDILTDIKLKKSVLTPQGPIYTDIYTHRLKED